jgi:CBS domain-containing protein
MSLKLRAGLAELDTGKQISGDVDTSRLSSLDRDLLKEALGVVKRFKNYLRQHFRLDLA